MSYSLTAGPFLMLTGWPWLSSTWLSLLSLFEYNITLTCIVRYSIFQSVDNSYRMSNYFIFNSEPFPLKISGNSHLLLSLVAHQVFIKEQHQLYLKCTLERTSLINSIGICLYSGNYRRNMTKLLSLSGWKSYSRNTFTYTKYLMSIIECSLTICQNM